MKEGLAKDAPKQDLEKSAAVDLTNHFFSSLSVACEYVGIQEIKSSTLIDENGSCRIIEQADFDARFKIEYETYTFNVHGQPADVPCITTDEISARIIKERIRIADTFGRAELLKDRIKNGDYTASELCDTKIGAISYHCRTCRGGGNVNCTSCGGHGQQRCCATGRQDCPRCFGLGYLQSIHDNRETETCRYCMGYGKIACQRCHGTTYVTCAVCSGGGTVACNNCGQTGIISTITGLRSRLVCELVPGSRRLQSAEDQKLVEEWVSAGLKGAVPLSEEATTLPQSNLDSVSPIQTAPHSSPFESVFRLHVKLTKWQTKGKIVKGDLANTQFEASQVHLDKPTLHFTSSFLSPAMKKIAREAEGMVNLAPSKFIERMRQKSSRLGRELSQLLAEGTDSNEIGVIIERNSSGAISSTTVHPIIKAYKSTIANYAKTAAREASARPVLLVILLWLFTQLCGLPAIAQGHPVWLGAYIILPVLLTWAAITRAIKKAIRRETGIADASAVFVWEALLIPAMSLIVFAGTGVLNLNLFPHMLPYLIGLPPEKWSSLK